MFDNHWAIIGFDRERADKIAAEIQESYGKDVKTRVTSTYGTFTIFSDGTTLTWIPKPETMLGLRIGRMWLDKEISQDVYDKHIGKCFYGDSSAITVL